jgi:hypothetical protein
MAMNRTALPFVYRRGPWIAGLPAQVQLRTGSAHKKSTDTERLVTETTAADQASVERVTGFEPV